MQRAGNSPIDGKYHFICGSLGVTVKLRCSRLCVTSAVLEVAVKLQYSRFCVTSAFLEVTEITAF
jgi:hypothetical protein